MRNLSNYFSLALAVFMSSTTASQLFKSALTVQTFTSVDPQLASTMSVSSIFSNFFNPLGRYQTHSNGSAKT